MKIGKKVLSGIKAPSAAEMTGGASGAGVAGFVGSSMGIAAFGTAFSAMIPFAVVGGIVGWLGVKAYSYRDASSQTDLTAGPEGQ